MFIDVSTIESYLKPLDKKNSSLLLSIFKPFITVEDFMIRILNLLDGAKDHVSVMKEAK